MEVWRDIIENGDSGVERFVSEYGDRLLAAAALLCRNNADAEDLAFRALERAVQRIRAYRPPGRSACRPGPSSPASSTPRPRCGPPWANPLRKEPRNERTLR